MSLPAFHFHPPAIARSPVDPLKRKVLHTGRCPVKRIWEGRKKTNKQTNKQTNKNNKTTHNNFPLTIIESLLLSLLPRLSHPASLLCFFALKVN